jgi:hypothetical protein
LYFNETNIPPSEFDNIEVGGDIIR